MAKIKFRAKIASSHGANLVKFHISFGGTSHSFFSRSSFSRFEKIYKKIVKSASGVSIFVEKGLVELPSDNDHFSEAYHAPQFSTNKLSVGVLTVRYKILFTIDSPAKLGVSTCNVTHRSKTKVALTSPISDGLFIVKKSDYSISPVNYQELVRRPVIKQFLEVISPRLTIHS